MTTTGAAAETAANGAAGNAQKNGTAAKEIEKRPIELFKDTLDKMQKEIERALPEHIDYGRFMRIVLTAVQRESALLECTRYSLFNCILQLAQLGLEPDGLLGHAYILPYNERYKDGNTWKSRKVAQVVIGYKGFLKLMRQSGEVLNVAVRVVRESDKFEYEFGLNEKLVHVPCLTDDPGPLKFVYIIVWLKGGGTYFDVMGKWEVDRVRAVSKAPDSPAWLNHYDEMCKKTMIRRGAKMSPSSVDDRVSRAVALDERHDAGLDQQIDSTVIDVAELPAGDVEPEGKPPEPSSLKQRKEISGLIAKAHVAEADVVAWFHRDDNKRETIEQLTRAEADEAIRHLNQAIAEAEAAT